MDIHRCRFLPYPASSINAVAFNYPSYPKGARNAAVRLALGRANGAIEIWNPLNGAWYQELTIPGGEGRSIDGLVWVVEPNETLPDGKTLLGKCRLFSIGYTATVTEWDLEKAQAKKHASGQHGDIWCLAAQPGTAGAKEAASRKLVAGTIDGSLVMYNIDGDDLRMQRVFVKTSSKNVKMVSVTFQSRNVLVVGCSDSTMRAYSIRQGTILGQMTFGSDLAGGSKDIIVWAVKCLPNGDIVSGDSTGQVCIWDGKTYTQVQRIQSHTQDVLSLATSADGQRIISGGMDKRTVFYEPMTGQDGRWTKMWHRRYHSHDVKTLASFEGKGDMSVVVSGGPDAAPVVMPLRRAGQEYHRNLSHLPQGVPLVSAPGPRLIVSWWERRIQIWQIPRTAKDVVEGIDNVTTTENNRQLVGRILVKGESNISSVAISDDGTLLVVSTATDVKAFGLRLRQGKPKMDLRITKISVLGKHTGATKVQISPNKLWVCWVEECSRIIVGRVTSAESDDMTSYSIARAGKLNRLRRNIPKHILLGGLGSYNRNVTHVTFSPDSRMLVAADLCGYVDSWVCESRGSSYNDRHGAGEQDVEMTSTSESSDDGQEERSHGWIRNPNAKLMPKLPHSPVVVSFADQTPAKNDSHGDYKLLMVTTAFEVFLFNPIRGALSDWSRRNPTAKLPEKMQRMTDLVKGVLWQGPRVWLYGVSFLFMLDLSQDLPAKDVPDEDSQQKETKRKRQDKSSGAGGRMKRYAMAPDIIKVAVGGSESSEWVDVDTRLAGGSKANRTVREEDDGVEGKDEEDDDVDDDGGGEVTRGGELQTTRDAQATANGYGAASAGQRPSWWHTYKYRPILGIVPLQRGQVSAQTFGAGAELEPLEVALVERPIWDVDLPHRYLADGE